MKVGQDTVRTVAICGAAFWVAGTLANLATARLRMNRDATGWFAGMAVGMLWTHMRTADRAARVERRRRRK